MVLQDCEILAARISRMGQLPLVTTLSPLLHKPVDLRQKVGAFTLVVTLRSTT
jgi:hypothetical protein